MEKSQEYPSYYVICQGGSGEITEKKSRFIATIEPVASEVEAQVFFERVKKQYWDARHNCTACIIGEKSEWMRYSDDGEPSGTAGKPMLEVLIGAGLTFTGVVVTRYFGGTLLGTGGLVRAYTQAVKAGLENCITAVMEYGNTLLIRADYNQAGKLQYLLSQRQLEPRIRYGEAVEMEFTVPLRETECLTKELTDCTDGKVIVEIKGSRFYMKKCVDK